jgi:CubicO group peptidase (beta-lactamase class C family)
MGRIVILLLYILLFPYAVAAEDVAKQPEKDIKQEITKSVNSYIESHKLYVTYAIADASDIFLKGAAGFYDVEAKKKLQVTNVMPTASATKNFTAVAVLLLQDRGLLNVQDPISKHLPANSGIWPNGKMPNWAHKITIHHLLTHSSGLVEHVGYFKPDRKKSDTQLIKDVVAYAVNKPLEYEPGTKSTYSDTGFVVLGLIIEAKTGKQLSEFLKKELFTPIGMKDSFLESVSGAFKVLAGDSIDKYPVGYYSVSDTQGNRLHNSRLVRVADTKASVVAYAGTAGVSNVIDLTKWNIALHHGKILSAKSYEQMITPYFKAAVDIGDVESMLGYGIYLTKLSDGTVFYHHEGRSYGLRSDFGYVPAHDISIAIMSNIVHSTNPRDENESNKILYPEQYVDIVDFRESIFAGLSDNVKEDQSEEGPHKEWFKTGTEAASVLQEEKNDKTK